MSIKIQLTPTQDLILEVLAARYRLGENLWTFDSRHRPALTALQALGYVNVIHGTVERSIRASLTEAGKLECLDSGYTPPILVKPKKHKKIKKW